MSEENIPKLRLKPRLTKDTPAPVAPPATAAPPPPPGPVESLPLLPGANPAPEAKGMRLKPRLPDPPAAPAVPENAQATPAPTVVAEAPAPAQSAAPGAPAASFPPPSKPVLKPGGNQASASPAVAPGEPLPKVLNAPPPPGLGSNREKVLMDAEPAEIEIIRKVSNMPFPAPTTNLPSLLGAEDSVLAGESGAAKRKVKPGPMLLAVLALVVVGGAAFFGYKYFSAGSPAPAIVTAKPPVAAQPVPAPASGAPAPAKSPKDQPAPVATAATTSQTLPAPPQAASAAPGDAPAPADQSATSDEQTPAAAPAAPVGPPLPSLAFKAWVLNLQVRGVRGGANPRVFIEHTAYAPGDVVDPELGIIFVGYNSDTGILTFKDRAGAIVEHRN